MANLNDALNLAQEALERCYWDEEKQYYEHHFPEITEDKIAIFLQASCPSTSASGFLSA